MLHLARAVFRRRGKAPVVVSQPVVDVVFTTVTNDLVQLRLNLHRPHKDPDTERADLQFVPRLQGYAAVAAYRRGRAVDVGLTAEVAQAVAAVHRFDARMLGHHRAEALLELPVVAI